MTPPTVASRRTCASASLDGEPAQNNGNWQPREVRVAHVNERRFLFSSAGGRLETVTPRRRRRHDRALFVAVLAVTSRDAVAMTWELGHRPKRVVERTDCRFD
jgi:hypothetical protein